MVLLLFVKCSCTIKVFFTEKKKSDLLNFGGTFCSWVFVLPFLKKKCNIKKNKQQKTKTYAPISNATSAYKYEDKNIYRTFNVVDKTDDDMY